MDNEALENQNMEMEPEMGQGMDQMFMDTTPVQDGMPYFMGDEAIVRFTSDSDGYGPATYWLVNKTDNTIRPFESESALKRAFGAGFETAKKHIVKLVSPEIDENNEIEGGVLSGFTVLGSDYAIKEDGSAKPLQFSPGQLKKRYGKPINEDAENKAINVLETMFNKLKSREGGEITPNQIDNLKKDSQLMAFYISALAYGNYTPANIYLDIKKRLKE